MQVSKELLTHIKIHAKKRQYEIAQETGMHPSTLSKILIGAEKIKPGDSRIKRVCEVVGFPFERAIYSDDTTSEMDCIVDDISK